MTNEVPTTDERKPVYDGVESWVRDWLLVNLNRPWGEVGTIRWCWCPRWWEHNEALLRLTALWFSWKAPASNRPA